MSEPLPPSTPAATPPALPSPSDTLLQQALTLLDGERRPSISYLQRHLRLGYLTALGLRHALEALGHVDPQGIMDPESQGGDQP